MKDNPGRRTLHEAIDEIARTIHTGGPEVRQAASGLTLFETAVLLMRARGKSLATVAAEVGVGPERIRQIEHLAHRKMRFAISQPFNPGTSAVVGTLGLSARTQNALLEDGRIRTLDDLVQFSPRDLAKIDGLGRAGITEIQRALSWRGMRLKEDDAT